jgi:signal transduction histidine kinase/CheY-like chemotaxis protein
MIRMDFRTRVLLAAALPAVLIAVVLAVIFSVRQFGSLEDALAARGRAEARQLADAADFGIFSGNRQLLDRLVRNMSQGDADITAATIVDDRGTTLARSGISVLPHLPDERQAERVFVAGGALVVVMPIRRELLEIEDIYSGGAVAPARAAVGGLVVLELSRERLRREQVRLLALGAAVTLLGLLLGGLLAGRIARGVTRPVQRLGEVVRRIAAGDLSARVTADPSGAVRPLEDGINEMAQRIATNQEHLRARIAEATAELRSRKDEAESATAAKSRFLAAASHDLRQPMHALGLFVSRLGTLQLSHEAHGVVRHIEASAAALEDLLDALFDVSRIDAGLVVPRIATVPVECLFDHVALQLGESARRQGLDFRRHASGGLRLRTDPVLVERILGNLVGNALRYTDRGGLLLACRRRGKRARLEVWDTGIGIPGELQQAIFEEYVQLGNPERDRAKGLGLGLSICQRLAHLLDTTLHLRSVPGRGSVFWFEVPLEEATEPGDVARQPDADTSGGETGELSGTIVIVDDDELVLASTTELVVAWGCRVVAGTSLADVMVECSGLAAPPAVAIFDYRLRGPENGLHAARALRQRFGDIPVMILTGNLTEQLRREAAQYGFTLLAKPLKPARLRALLQHMLGGGT